MGSDDLPKSVRIRTVGENEFWYRAIERAAEFYDKNWSDAVAYSGNDIVRLDDAVEEDLYRGDLTPD